MDAFLEPIHDAVACVAKAKVNLSPNGRGMVGKIHALTLNDDQPITLKCRPTLLFKVKMQYEVVRTEHQAERGPWRVSTRGYMYELQTASGELVWSFHWHPTSRIGSPHVHIGRTQLAADAVISSKAHHPTGRVSLESVIRACIADYGVTPVKGDWEEVLARREADFETYRTWP